MFAARSKFATLHDVCSTYCSSTCLLGVKLMVLLFIIHKLCLTGVLLQP